MASKQPFKLIDVVGKVTTWSLRIHKFFKHRILSQRKNAILIGGNDSTSHITDANMKFEKQFFSQYLVANLLRTWEVTRIIKEAPNIEGSQKLPQKQAQTAQQIQGSDERSLQKQEKQQGLSDTNPEFIVNHYCKRFNDFQWQKSIEEQYQKKQFDSIIVLPPDEQQNEDNLYPDIQSEQFATEFINTYEEAIMKNLFAYRLAARNLTTTGSLILSSSEYDFTKQAEDEKSKFTKEQREERARFKQLSERASPPPAGKQIIDCSIHYLGVLVGDRDHTDLNSWPLVSLSEEPSLIDPEFVAKMYYDWADGQSLPMPGSFTMFKRKEHPSGDKSKQRPFVEYL